MAKSTAISLAGWYCSRSWLINSCLASVFAYSWIFQVSCQKSFNTCAHTYTCTCTHVLKFSDNGLEISCNCMAAALGG